MIEALRVRVFGEFRFEGADLSALRSRKARTLLKMLAVRVGHAVAVDSLVDGLWQRDLPADPAREVAVLVSRARGVVGASRLLRREDGYVLHADWCDLDEVQALVREASARASRGDAGGAHVAAEAALRLADAVLLADEVDAPWLVPVRRESDAVVAEARALAADGALAAGRTAEAAAHARAALAHDPYDESALRTLMTAHVRGGRPASALAAYADVRERLAEDLGVSPSDATEALHTAILMGDVAGADARAASAAHGVTAAVTHDLLVGRDDELAALDRAFERSRSAAEVVLVSGEAGAGKTHLVRTWAQIARARGALVLEGRATAGLGMALQPVLDAIAVAEHDAASISAPPDAARGAGWWGVPGPSASPAAMQDDLFAGLTARLQAMAPPSGIALIIDDVHEADQTTLAWIATLVRRPRELPIMLVATYRSGEDVTVPSTGSIEVGPLPRQAVVALYGAERAAELWERTAGNALLLVELASMDPAGPETVPATVREAVTTRLRAAGDAGVTLRTAAVLGSTIDLDLLAGVLGASPVDVLGHLDEGVRRAFLTESNGRMVFRHDLVRDALVADATSARRAWVHRQAAHLLAARPAPNPMDVAVHARAGGDVPLAAEALADAADVARARFDLPGAERLLADAIDAHDTADLRLRRSRLRMARGDLRGADEDAEAALGAGAGARALELRAWAARNRHDMETAIRLGAAGADAAQVTADNTTQASCLVAVALAHRGLGDLRRADALMADAAALQPEPSLGLQAWVGLLRVHQGRVTEALTALEPMIGAEAGGMLSFWVEHVVQMLGHAYGHHGRAVDALAMMDRLEMELERRGSSVRYGGLALSYRSWILRNLGDPSAADLARQGVEQGHTPEIRAQSMLDLADSLLAPGRKADLDGAGTALDAATAALEMRWFHNRWRAEQRRGVIAARLDLLRGQPEAASAIALGTAAAASDRADARYAVLARLVAARAAARLGELVDVAAVEADLTQLPHVAGLEAWWLAADVADDTGIGLAAVIARRSAAQLILHAGDHAPTLRREVAARLG
jgi:DNA-binding SARP family transcriptional activator